MTQTTEQILEIVKLEAEKTVDCDLLGNPITDADVLLMGAYGPLVIRIVNAAIESYKAELLKEVGEPVAYMTTDEEGSASMLFFDRSEALKYSGDDDPVNLFTESRVAELEAENANLLAANRDCIEHFNAMQQDLAAAQLQIKTLREALELVEIGEAINECILSAGDCGNIAREALSQPTSTEALDAYVAKRLHDMACDKGLLRIQVAELTRQRDLAVEALKIAAPYVKAWPQCRGNELSIVEYAIKESEGK